MATELFQFGAHYYHQIDYELYAFRQDPNLQSLLKRIVKTFEINIKKIRKTIKYPCNLSFNFIRNIIRKTVPFYVFGSNYNFRKFCELIKLVLTSSVHETITHEQLVKKFNLNDIFWLNNISNKKYIFAQWVKWMLIYIKMKVIRMYYFIQRDTKTHQVFFYPIPEYRRLCSKALFTLTNNGRLIPRPHFDIKGKEGQQWERQYATKLSIFPKKDMQSYRLLTTSKILKKDYRAKMICEKFRNQGYQLKVPSLYTAWIKCIESVKHGQPLYGVKLDLQDAFGNVDLTKLKPFIQNCLRRTPEQLALVMNVLENQIVKVNKGQFFRWNNGLMQGMKLSAALCNLDRRSYDSNIIQKYADGANFFHRSTDDYFLCSVDQTLVRGFLETMKKHSKLQESKTETNVNDIHNSVVCYYGRLFDLETKEVKIKIDSSLTTYRHKSKLYFKNMPNNDIYKYLKNITSVKMNTFHFSKLLFNTSFNSKDVVIENFFKFMIMIAFKIDSALICKYEKPPEKLNQCLMDIIKYYVKRTRELLVSTKSNKYEKMGICRSSLKFSGVRAFILVFQKRSLTYKLNLKYLKKFTGGKKKYFSQLGRPLYNKLQQLPDEFKDIRMSRSIPPCKE